MKNKKNLIMKILFLIITWGFIYNSQSVQAGNGSSGGGIVFQCENDRGQKEFFLADVYDLLQSNESKFKDLTYNSNENEALTAVLNVIRKSDAETASTLIENLNLLKFVAVDSLPLNGDDDIASVPATCKNGKKVQMAVQHFDTNIVNYVPEILAQLSPVEQVLFKLHEANVKIFGANTNQARNAVSAAAENRIFQGMLRLGNSADIVQNKYLVKLAQIMNGRQLECVSDNKFGPIRLTMADLGNGKALYAVDRTSDFFQMEYSKNWLIFHAYGPEPEENYMINLNAETLADKSTESFPGVYMYVDNNGSSNETKQLSCTIKP